MPTRQSIRQLLVALLILVSAAQTSLRGQTRNQRYEQQPKPRLVLVIVVDQFRYDYLERFGDLFVEDGIKRLMRDGAVWVNANYDYIPTKTAPGHAAIMTGAPPAGTGLVANEWLDRQTSEKITSVTDPSVKVLGGGPTDSSYSPHLLQASSVGDELRKASGDRAKVIGVSDKARAAIFPAGRRGNAAYWLSADNGTIVSSSYYFPRLPQWVVDFNQTRPLDKHFGARWDRLLPESEYLKRAGADAPPWENIDAAPAETNKFPHVVTGGVRAPATTFYDHLDHSPFVNDVILALAEQAITNEDLGKDHVTDLLTVSLSGNDHVGHRFGPYSHEVMDVTLRVDRQIASFLNFVDKQVGLNQTLCVLSSDHGVSPLLDWITMKRVARGRIPTAEIMTGIRSAIKNHYGPRKSRNPKPGTRNSDDYIMKYPDKGQIKDAMFSGNIYFNREALKRDGVNLDELTELAGKATLKIPGMARYFTRAQLERCQKVLLQSDSRSGPCSDAIARKAVRGFYAERSGDLVIVPKPYNYLGDSTDPANHGTPYSYDTHVPMIIMGRGIRAGRYSQRAAPTDIAPTLAAILGIPTPNKSQGRILKEALIDP